MSLAALMTVLIARRMELGITQRNLAYLMNTSQGRISDIENLRYVPRISTLERYAELVKMRLTLSLVDD
jgi:transcriptional regulator with XRE-family HTH domain